MDSDPRTPGEGRVEAMLKAGDRQGRLKQRKQGLKLSCGLQQETSGRKPPPPFLSFFFFLQPALNRLFPICEKTRVRCPKSLLSTQHPYFLQSPPFFSLPWAQTSASCLFFNRSHFSNTSPSKQPNKTPQTPLKACDPTLTHPDLGEEATDTQMATPIERGCCTTQSQAREAH